MPANILTEEERNKDFKKTEYFRYDIGTHQVRFLTPNAVLKYTHWVLDRYSIECLGDDCPICENNERLKLEFPTDYKKQRGYNGQQRTHFLNLLDRSPIKTCANGHQNKSINGKFYPTCTTCGVVLPKEYTPANIVKVASFSEANMRNLVNIENAILNKDQEVIGWTNYDIALIITKPADKKVITPQALTQFSDPVEVNPDELYDLDTAVMHLERDEIKALFQGIDLRDIYRARYTPKATIEDATMSLVGNSSIEFVEQETKVQLELDNLFNS